jgi:hypothetical protein
VTQPRRGASRRERAAQGGDGARAGRKSAGTSRKTKEDSRRQRKEPGLQGGKATQRQLWRSRAGKQCARLSTQGR